MLVSVHGRLGRDVRMVDTKSGKAMAVGSLCVEIRNRSGEYQPEWFEIVAFGKLADSLSIHRKGESISCFGRSEISEFTNAAGDLTRQLRIVLEGLVSASSVHPVADKMKAVKDGALTEAPFDDRLPF